MEAEPPSHPPPSSSAIPPAQPADVEMTEMQAEAEVEELPWEYRFLNSISPGLGDHLHRHYSQEQLAAYMRILREDQTVALPDRHQRTSICLFFIVWYRLTQMRAELESISREAWLTPLWSLPDIIRAEDVDEHIRDIQGIRWDLLEQKRCNARRYRATFYKTVSPRLGDTTNETLPQIHPAASKEPFFDFYLSNTQLKPVVEHFQLRNVLATTSRTDVYYASGRKVMRTNLLSTEPDCVMDLSATPHGHQKATQFCITTLAAEQRLLVAGGFSGDYALVDTSSTLGTRPTVGILSEADNAVMNHVHIFNDRRNGSPRAIFASNDTYLRILDCSTNRMIAQMELKKAVNCAATSSDGRLRLVVGDFPSAILLDADTGQEIARMETHRADAFACAWSEDNVQVAWASQDKHIYIVDTRTWKPLFSIPTEQDCVCSLRFSPPGGGRPVLVAAEAADFVHIFDTQTYQTQQTIDFFGNVAGTAFSADGRELLIANSDAKFGGIMSFRRAGFGNAASVRDHFVVQEWDPTGQDSEPLHHPDVYADLTVGQRREWDAPERLGLERERLKVAQSDRRGWMSSALKEVGDDILF